MSVLASIPDLSMTEFVYGMRLMKTSQFFSQAFNEVDPSIKYIWSLLSPSAIFLDLSTSSIEHEIYSKPGNAYAFLQHGSFHVHKSYPAWIKALLSTALTLLRLF